MYIYISEIQILFVDPPIVALVVCDAAARSFSITDVVMTVHP